MSNPVIDKLENWQPDSDTIDSNLPVPATSIGVSTSGDLAAELRRIKSEIRGESINKSWERWKGITNLVGNAPIAFGTATPTNFFVNDNFISAIRNLAIVGRRVRAVQASGFNMAGTIVAASYNSGTGYTSVEVLWDAYALDNTLYEIQFGLDGNSLASRARVLAVQHQSGAISNTDQETALISYVIPPNYLGTQNQIELNILSRFGLVSAGEVLILAMYGGQQITAVSITNLGVGTIGAVLCPIKVTLTAFGTGTQTLVLEVCTTNGANNVQDIFAGLCQNMASAGAITQDSTLAQSLDVHVIFNTANPANQADYLGARLELYAA